MGPFFIYIFFYFLDFLEAIQKGHPTKVWIFAHPTSFPEIVRMSETSLLSPGCLA